MAKQATLDMVMIGAKTVPIDIYYTLNDDRSLLVLPREEVFAAIVDQMHQERQVIAQRRSYAQEAEDGGFLDDAKRLRDEASAAEVKLDIDAEKLEMWRSAVINLKAKDTTECIPIELKMPSKAKIIQTEIACTRKLPDGKYDYNAREVAANLLPGCIVGKTPEEVEQIHPNVTEELLNVLVGQIYPNLESFLFLSFRRANS